MENTPGIFYIAQEEPAVFGFPIKRSDKKSAPVLL